MKFVYKIYSNFDGFTPKKIPERIQNGRFLPLVWRKYLDSVERGAECWVYFHGRHSFSDGVYIKGFVSKIDRERGYVILRAREYRTDAPLTEQADSDRISKLVSVKYRQVFLWPAEWDTVPECDLESCRKRLCGRCPTWRSLPTIDPNHLNPPERARSHGSVVFVPAYWAIPSRCYAYMDGIDLARHVRISTHLFENFKLGEKAYAYPLALGIFNALQRRGLLEFDAIVPIPLSPDKAAEGEIHRTRLLANELGRLLGAPVKECLTLNVPISKRMKVAQGHTRRQFERMYNEALEVKGKLDGIESVLLVDDAMTHGSTMSQAIIRLKQANENVSVVAASAVQMIVRESVRDETGFSV